MCVRVRMVSKFIKMLRLEVASHCVLHPMWLFTLGHLSIWSEACFALRKSNRDQSCCGRARGSVPPLDICVSKFSLHPLMRHCYLSPSPPDSCAATSHMNHWRLEQCKIERNCTSRTDWLRSCLTHAWVILQKEVCGHIRGLMFHSVLYRDVTD